MVLEVVAGTSHLPRIRCVGVQACHGGIVAQRVLYLCGQAGVGDDVQRLAHHTVRTQEGCRGIAVGFPLALFAHLVDVALTLVVLRQRPAGLE